MWGNFDKVTGHKPNHLEINVVCCVGRLEIQIKIQKGWCTADSMDSKIQRFKH